MRLVLLLLAVLLPSSFAAVPAQQLQPHPGRRESYPPPNTSPPTPAAPRFGRLQVLALTLASAAALRRLLADERRQAALLADEARAAAARRELHRQWSAWESSMEGEGPAGPQPPDAQAAGTEASAEDLARRAAAEAEARSRYTLYARTVPERPGVTPEGSPRAEVERLLRLRRGPPRPLATLRLSLGAVSPAAVARAYRRLSSRIHPDKNSHPGASEAQAVLNAARDALLARHKGAPSHSPERSASEPETET